MQGRLGKLPLLRIDSMPPHAIDVDVDSETRSVEGVDVPPGGRHRVRGDIFAERGVRQRQRPGETGNDGRCMQRRGAGHARFAGLAGDIHAHAEAIAEPRRFDHAADAADLDRFQADAARRLVLVMAANVVERMNAFVGANGGIACRGNLRHAGQIVAATGCSKKPRPEPLMART